MRDQLILVEGADHVKGLSFLSLIRDQVHVRPTVSSSVGICRTHHRLLRIVGIMNEEQGTVW